MTKSYTFNGMIDTSYEAWEQWKNDALMICNELGYMANYYDIGLSGKLSGKARSISGIQRKMENIKKKNDVISGMSIMVLPEDYSSASFDYIITLSRNANYITLIINQDYRMCIDESIIIDMLRKNIVADSGEVYEMDIYDCPEFYAGKANPKESFKSLKKVEALM